MSAQPTRSSATKAWDSAAAIEQAAGPIVVLGPGGVVRFANRAACRLFEIDFGDAEGAELSRWLTDTDAARFGELIAAWAERREPLQFVRPVRTAVGRQKWCQWHVCAVAGEAAEEERWIVLTLQEIDALRDGEQQAREEARRWRRLAEDVCHGLWEVDHRGRTV
ncbi:MAG: PAS domain S-box protein, partial [Planctomycetota bacterium]